MIRGFTGKCLDVYRNATDDGTKVQLWTCDGSAEQQWTLANGQLTTRSGKCLTVPSPGGGNGAKLVISECDGGAGQRWSFSRDLHASVQRDTRSSWW